MNERIAVFDVSPKSAAAHTGSTARSRPTIAPTNALTSTSSENCCQFCLRPGTGSTASGSTFEVACANCGSIGRRLRNVAQHRRDERVAVLDAERAIEGALESDRGCRFAAECAAAYRTGKRARPHFDVIPQLSKTLRARIEQRGPFVRADGELGPAHVADHQGMAGQNHPGLWTAA